MNKGDNKYFFRMFGFMKPYALAFIIGKFIYSSQGFFPSFILTIFLGSLTAAVVAGDISGVFMAVYILVAMVLIFMVVLYFGVLLDATSQLKGVRDLKQKLFRAFVKNNIEKAHSSHSGEGIAAINTDANTAATILGEPLALFARHVINVVFAAIFIFILEWRIALIALIIGIINFFAQNRFTKPIAKIGKQQLAVNATVISSASNNLSGAMAIRAYNMHDKALNIFENDNGKLRMLGFKRAFISMWQQLFVTIQGWLAMVLVFGLGGFFVATGELMLSSLIMMPAMAMSIISSFGGLGQAYADLQVPIVGAKRVFSILDSADENINIKNDETYRKPDGYEISINNLNFSYLNAESKSLENINLNIKENEMVAFVGASGSGKSTLLRVIIGMYERDNFDIQIGDLSYVNTSLNNFRQNFAYVDQSCKLFDMSIKENIALGYAKKYTDNNKNQDISQESFTEAAKKALAHDFIMELDGGYDAPCGEKGSTLSGGQKQRIAIARALVKSAPILVFDEATSALDLESERHIMSTIQNLRQDHTILITTHNLENIINADKIVVMDTGKIVEIGTHAELMDKKGVYTKLYIN